MYVYTKVLFCEGKIHGLPCIQIPWSPYVWPDAVMFSINTDWTMSSFHPLSWMIANILNVQSITRSIVFIKKIYLIAFH